MIPERDRVDSAEAWMWQSAGEDDVTIEPALARRDLGKRHPHLKGNARLLREDNGRPARGDCAADRLEQQTDRPILALKVVGQVVPAAGVRLIAVGEATLASLGRQPPAQRGHGIWDGACSLVRSVESNLEHAFPRIRDSC